MTKSPRVSVLMDAYNTGHLLDASNAAARAGVPAVWHIHAPYEVDVQRYVGFMAPEGCLVAGDAGQPRDCRVGRRLLPRCRPSPTGGAVAADVRLAGHLSAATGHAQQAAGEWSDTLYTLYTLNPLAGFIDAFQSVVLRDAPLDLNAMMPGAIMIAILLPLSYLYFKRAESYFAYVI